MDDSLDLHVESFVPQSPSLRIAIVTETFPPEVNGVAMTLGRLVEGTLARGHSVQLIRPRQEHERDVNESSNLEQILSAGVALPTYGEVRFGLPSKHRLTKLWSRRPPDVVHVVTEGPLGWSAVAAAKKLRLPVTSSFHTNFQSYSKHYGVGVLRPVIEGYLRKLHNRTQATMVPTKALVASLQNQGYSNVKLLSRGVATDLFSPSKRSAALRRSWGAGEDDTVVLLVGRLAKEKNVELVIAAFREIQSRSASARLVFVGDGPLRSSMEATFPQAIFSGNQRGEALAAHYASGDLFLFPSLTETFGNVVPEALASGLAVVAYGNAAALELIESGRNGVLVEPGSEREFIAAALELASDRSRLDLFKSAASASISHLDWDRIYDQFIEYLTNAYLAGNVVSSTHGSSIQRLVVSPPTA
jgi:glycosyltransferase involved in cell wall biosynthesis